VETFSYQKLIFINVQNSHIVILALVYKILNPVVRKVKYENESDCVSSINAGGFCDGQEMMTSRQPDRRYQRNTLFHEIIFCFAIVTGERT
jgi:hypothetical protein